MASAPSPVTVLVEDIYSAKQAIDRGGDARAVMAALHHKAALIGERADLADSLLRVGVTPYTQKKWQALTARQAARGGRPERLEVERPKIIRIRRSDDDPNRAA